MAYYWKELQPRMSSFENWLFLSALNLPHLPLNGTRTLDLQIKLITIQPCRMALPKSDMIGQSCGVNKMPFKNIDATQAWPKLHTFDDLAYLVALQEQYRSHLCHKERPLKTCKINHRIQTV